MSVIKYIVVLTIIAFGYDYSNINPLLEATVSSSTNARGVYINKAHNFKLTLPSIFKKTPSKEDKNFALFKSLDNQATLLVAFKNDNRPLKNIYYNTLDNLKNRANIKFGFHKYFGKWYVISILDIDKDTISYQKGFKKRGVHIFYILSYPNYQKKKYDSVIKSLNRGFGYTSKVHKKRTTIIRGGTWCDKYYRTCSLECFDKVNEDSCLNICEAKQSRCYKTGKFR
jgi:hypothetical protein